MRGEPALPVGCRSGGVSSAREDVEECVALCVHFLAAVRGEGLAQEALVLGEHAAVSVSKQLQQLRRPLHVGERKGDCAPGPLAHAVQ